MISLRPLEPGSSGRDFLPGSGAVARCAAPGLVLLVLALTGAASGEAQERRPLALTNATLIDGTGTLPRPGITVLIDGEAIVDVFPTGGRPLPSSAEVLDLDGQYLIPGLINSHLHLPMLGWTRDSVAAGLERMLRAGVTAVREMAGDARLAAELNRATLIEGAPFPTIYYAVRMAGPGFYGVEGREGARSWIGYEPGTAPWAQAVTAETDLAHAFLLFFGLRPGGAGAWTDRTLIDAEGVDLESGLFPELLGEMKTRGVIMDATARNAAEGGAAGRAGCTTELLNATLRAMHQAGVPISTGTDYFLADGEPDPTLFTEIEYLVEAGVLDPLEAITAATLNGARAIGIEASHGSVESGKVADLVVLSADPAADIGALRDVFAVVKGGRLYRTSR